jgi:hypothetical protein
MEADIREKRSLVLYNENEKELGQRKVQTFAHLRK